MAGETPAWLRARQRRMSEWDLIREAEISYPPVDVLAVAQLLEVRVIYWPQDENWKGLAKFDQVGATIWVRTSSPHRFQRHMIAFQLGTILLHPFGTYPASRFYGPSYASSSYRFSQNLLIPQGWLRAFAAGSGYDPVGLAALFEVEVPAMNHRLQEVFS